MTPVKIDLIHMDIKLWKSIKIQTEQGVRDGSLGLYLTHVGTKAQNQSLQVFIISRNLSLNCWGDKISQSLFQVCIWNKI